MSKVENYTGRLSTGITEVVRFVGGAVFFVIVSPLWIAALLLLVIFFYGPLLFLWWVVDKPVGVESAFAQRIVASKRLPEKSRDYNQLNEVIKLISLYEAAVLAPGADPDWQSPARPLDELTNDIWQEMVFLPDDLLEIARGYCRHIDRKNHSLIEKTLVTDAGF